MNIMAHPAISLWTPSPLCGCHSVVVVMVINWRGLVRHGGPGTGCQVPCYAGPSRTCKGGNTTWKAENSCFLLKMICWYSFCKDLFSCFYLFAIFNIILVISWWSVQLHISRVGWISYNIPWNQVSLYDNDNLWCLSSLRQIFSCHCGNLLNSKNAFPTSIN